LIKAYLAGFVGGIVGLFICLVFFGVLLGRESPVVELSALCAIGIGYVVYMLAHDNYYDPVKDDWHYYKQEEEEEEEYNEPVVEIPEHPALSHILLYGGAGQGKSALVNVCSNEMAEAYGHEVKFIEISPGQIRSKRDLDEVMLMVAASPYCALFIDEIHGLPRALSECLFKALQDFKFDITLTKEINLPEGYNISFSEERGVQTIDLPRFTCYGATTDPGLIMKPLRDRFTIRIEMSDYELEDLKDVARISLSQDKPSSFDTYAGQHQAKKIIKAHIDALSFEGDQVIVREDALDLIARLSWKTARLVKQRQKNCLDYAKSLGEHVVTPEIARDAMDMFGIDKDGYDRVHRAIIHRLVKNKNKALGSQALANAVGIQKDDVENVYLPELERSGIMTRDGRSMKILTEEAYEHFKDA
jgi:Holliday junction DNA helicase RuvB